MQILGAVHKGYETLPEGVKLASSGYDELPPGVKLADPTEPSQPGGFSSFVSGVADFGSAMDDLFSEVNQAALNTPADSPEYDAPTWLTGEIAPRHHKNLFHLRQATLEPGLEPEEYEKRMREAEMAGAMVNARQQLAQQEHQKFIDADDTEFSYARKKEIEELGDLGRLPGPVRGLAQGVNNLGGGVVSMLARVFPGLGSSDEHNRYMAGIEQGLTTQDEGANQDAGVMGDLSSASRRVASSLVEMAPAAATGGLGGVALQAGTFSSNQAYTQGVDAGLSHSQAMGYALGTGAIEGGLTMLFGKASPTLAKSLSGALGKSASQASKRLGLGSVLQSIAAETTEETTIAFSQAILDRVSGVDPDALKWENLSKRLYETGLAGAMGGGVGATLQATSSNVDQMVTTVEDLKSDDAIKGFMDGLASEATTTPGMSRREFAKATGNGKTSEEYRKGFTAAASAKPADPQPDPAGGVEPDPTATQPEPVDRSKQKGAGTWSPPVDLTPSERVVHDHYDQASGKYLWEMTADELWELRDKAKASEKTEIDRVFGDRASEYRKADSARKEEMEDELTHDKLDILYGWANEHPPSDVIDALSEAISLGSWDTMETTADFLAYRAADLPESTDVSTWKHENIQAAALYRQAFAEAKKNDWSTEKLTEAVANKMQRMYPDPADFQMMSERFGAIWQTFNPGAAKRQSPRGATPPLLAAPPVDPDIDFDPETLNAESQAAEVERLAKIEAVRPAFKKIVSYMKRNAEMGDWSAERLQHYFEKDPAIVQAIIEQADVSLKNEQGPIDDMRAAYEMYVKGHSPDVRVYSTRSGKDAARAVDTLASMRFRLNKGEDPFSIPGFDVKLQYLRDYAPELLQWRRGPGDTDDSVLVDLIITNNEELFPKLRRADFIDRAILDLDEMEEQQPVAAGYIDEDDDPYDRADILDDRPATADKTGRRRQPRPEPEPGPSAETGEYKDTPAANVRAIDGLDDFTFDRLVGLPMPELNELVKALRGELRAANLPEGVRGRAEVVMRRLHISRTLARTPAQLKKTVAHEIGHLLDYLPDETLKRGNLLGRLASLKAYRKEAIAGKPGGDPPLTPEDKARLLAEAEKLLSKNAEILIEREIMETMPITAEDVKAIWNSNDIEHLPPELVTYIKQTTAAEKLSIVKEALKGQVAAELQKFAKQVGTGKFEKVKVDQGDGPTKKAINEKYRDLIIEEIKKRKLITDAIVRKELKGVSFWWRPFDEARSSQTHREYRNSGVELYADAMSVFLNAPGELQQRAPTFFRGLLGYMNRKPELAAAYIELQSRLQGNPEDISRARREIAQATSEKGDQQVAAAIEADKRADASIREALMQDGLVAAWKHTRDKIIPGMKAVFFHRGSQLIHNQRKAGIKDPTDTSKGANVEIELEKFFRTHSVVKAWLENIGNFVAKPLKEAGIADSDFDYYLKMRRILNDRADVLNPDGHTPETASQELDSLRSSMGEEKFLRMVDIAQTFYDSTFEVAKRAKESGLISQNQWEETIVPNSDSYVTFAVLEHLGNKIGWGLHESKGTFDSIGNTFRATVMKMTSMLHAAEVNQSKKQVLLGHLLRDAPELITFAGKDPVKKNFERVSVFEDGKQAIFEVPDYYAEVFRKSESSQWKMLGKVMSSVTYGIFYPLYISLSYAFAVRNVSRDFERSYISLGTVANKMARERGQKGITWRDFIAARIKNIPTAHRRAMGDYDEKINRMLQTRALDTPFTSRSRHESAAWFDSAEYQAAAEQAGVIPRSKAGAWIDKGLKFWDSHLPRVLAARRLYMLTPRYWIDLTETAGKAGDYDLLKDRKFTDDEVVQLLNNHSSTPNTRVKGVAGDYLNGLSMFYSNRMAALRAHKMALEANPKDYARRMAIVSVGEVLLWKAAAAGVFGPLVALMISLIPDDEKDRNHVVPLYLTEDEDGETKVIYFAIPRDQTSSMASAMFRRLYDAAVETGDFDSEGAIQDVWANSIGTWSPPMDMLHRWTEYGHGQQPYDSFSGRPIVSDAEMRAGGWEAHRKMLAWTIKKFGAAEDVLKPITAPILGEALEEGTNTNLESLIRSIPGSSAILKITNRGHKSDLFERARETDLATDKVSVMVDRGSSRLAAEHHAMSRLNSKGELSDQEAEHYARMHWWYQAVYLPSRKYMKEELTLGQKERAQQIAADLKEITAATKAYWIAVDGGNAQQIREKLDALELLTAE